MEDDTVSRIGKVPIQVPKGVDFQVAPGGNLTAKGPKGLLTLSTQGHVDVKVEDGAIHVARHSDSKQDRAFHGLYHRLISNMLKGVTEGFMRELEIQGVGYRVAKEGPGLTFQLGFSHPVHFKSPEGITLDSKSATHVSVAGCDKQQVGHVAAMIRRLRPPEPYKGKGIRYMGERVRRKAGKTGA